MKAFISLLFITSAVFGCKTVRPEDKSTLVATEDPSNQFSEVSQDDLGEKLKNGRRLGCVCIGVHAGATSAWQLRDFIESEGSGYYSVLSSYSDISSCVDAKATYQRECIR